MLAIVTMASNGSGRNIGGGNKETRKGKEKQDDFSGSRERSDNARGGATSRSAGADAAPRNGGSDTAFLMHEY